MRNPTGYRLTPFVFLLIPLLFAGGVFALTGIRNEAEPKINLSELQNNTKDKLIADSDSDGLKDWEEQIYNTDPHNPDTDGDGTKDGEEITQGRDPLKPGPDDLLSKTTPSSPSNTSDETPNLTQKISQIFGQQYIVNFVQNPDQEQNLDAIAEQMAQAALQSDILNPHYITINNVVLLHSDNLDDIKNYLYTFDHTLGNAFKPVGDLNTVILLNKMAEEGIWDFTQINQIIDAYSRFIVSVKDMPIPEEFAPLHFDYINTTIKEQAALKKITKIETDPVLALIGMREFNETSIKFQGIRNDYVALQLKHGIVSQKK